MIRGCQKRIYYVKDTHSALFSEAYFVLRREETHTPEERELAEEARRIVDNFTKAGRLRPLREPLVGTGQKVGAFIVGAASSSALIGGIALLLAFA